MPSERNQEAILPEDVAYLARKIEVSSTRARSVTGEQELRRRGVQDLATAMAVASPWWIIEGETPPSPSHHPRVTRPKWGRQGSQGTLLRKDQAKALVARMAKARTSERSSRLGPIASCDGPHWARDCPKRKA
ncbi:hypothetical protein CK203_046331 [Vitis vinifera]|uniref:Uncharacterized protein n=1 Tax=Vitis vinifera TaxID=29760 RepID=A0A438FWB5_VITVI|nr:hypothetical protein CK203_046331 [Vitis vinifera]